MRSTGPPADDALPAPEPTLALRPRTWAAGCFVNRCERLSRDAPPTRAEVASLVIVFPPPPPSDLPLSRSPIGWDLHPIRSGVLASIAFGAGVLLWALAGWPGLVLAVALGVAVVIRLLGALLLPRRLRERSVTLALLAGLVVLLLQSSWGTIALTVGLAGIALALTQRGQTRTVALAVAALVAVLGGVGLVVDHISAAARQDA